MVSLRLTGCLPEMKTLGDLGACQEELEKTARAVQAIAHPTRLSIICFLLQGEQCVNDIAEVVGTSQSGVSQHLSILHQRNVLLSRKVHNRVYYRVRDERVIRLVEVVRQVYCPDLQAGVACA